MLKDLALALIAIVLLASVYRYGQMSPQQEAARLRPPAPVDPGEGSVVSLYNPDGRLLKFFEIRGPLERGESGELIFSTRDGKRVRTNATFVVESPAK